MFIQTEATPNPATLKFLPGRPVLPDGVLDIPDPAEAAKSPLAERLFAIPGVTGVFLGSDFITVTKADGDWQHVKPAILGPHPNGPDLHPVLLCQYPPWVGVGVVIQFGDDHDIARPPAVAERAA